MSFASLTFIGFFLFVTAVYYLLPVRARVIWLLAASYYFYMSWNAGYTILLIGVTAVTYLSGLALKRREKKLVGEKSCVILCAVFVFGLLFYFKYRQFFYDSLAAVLAKLRLPLVPRDFDILMPLGISFITFQSFGYVMDVYRKKVPAEKNFLRYALFVSFFPLVSSGPIERADGLLRQIGEKKQRISYEKFTNGMILMLYGYFQKIVLADKLAILTGHVFADPKQFDSLVLLIAAAAFSLQIYCDFSGYSHIAIGAAQILNFDVRENFNAPYLSRSISEFWRRWHISLGAWFRDYVYIPLGGNRCKSWRRYFNLMVTFLVSGLWHGAHGHFVVWGALNGCYQIIEMEGKRLRQKRKQPAVKKSWSQALLQILCTWALTTVAWIFFKADSVGTAVWYVTHLFTDIHIRVLFDGTLYTLGLARQEISGIWLGLLIVLLADIVRERTQKRVDTFLCLQNLWFKWFVLLTVIALFVIFGTYGPQYGRTDFIYGLF